MTAEQSTLINMQEILHKLGHLGITRLNKTQFVNTTLNDEVPFTILSCALPFKISRDANAIWDSVADGHYQECADEFGIDRAIGRDFLRNLYLPDTRAFHCFLRCLYKSTDFLNADGDFDIEVVVYKAHFLPYDLTEQCITESHMQPDLCDRAYTAAACAVSGLSGMDREALKVPRN